MDQGKVGRLRRQLSKIARALCRYPAGVERFFVERHLPRSRETVKSQMQWFNAIQLDLRLRPAQALPQFSHGHAVECLHQFSRSPRVLFRQPVQKLSALVQPVWNFQVI